MIKKGDLVMRVKSQPCCGDSWRVGIPFIAGEIIENLKVRCVQCERITTHTGVYDADGGTYPSITRLIKIDPPKLPEEVTKEEKEGVY